MKKTALTATLKDTVMFAFSLIPYNLSVTACFILSKIQFSGYIKIR